MRNGEQKLVSLQYHRNGVSEAGFYVAIIKEKEEGCAEREMLVIQTDDTCLAFDLKLLDERNIKFMENSWRGDYYRDIMKKHISEWSSNVGK